MTRIPLLSITSLLMMCWSAAGISARAQHFQQISGSLTQIAVGRAEVWGLNGSNIYRFNASQQKFNQITGSLARIAVGGGSLLQQDAVWGVNASGQVFQYNLNLNEFDFVPGVSLNQIAVGEGDIDNCHPYEVWGIGSGGSLWRYNQCKSAFQQYGSQAYTSVTVGSNDVWAIRQLDGAAAHFTLDVNGERYAYGESVQQITVGVNDIWGVDNAGVVYRFDINGNSFNDPYGCNCIAKQVAAGGDGVWTVALNTLAPTVIVSHLTFSSSSGDNGAGFFNPVFSVAVGLSDVDQLAVGSGGGVWLITSTRGFGFETSHQVYTWVRP